MLKKALAEAVDQATFNRLLLPAWKTSSNKLHMGIALSGGQDSMALVALCDNYRKSYADRNFTAFIVDHDVRPESRDEALKVRNIVRTKTSIDVEILKLTWTSHVHPSKLVDFESIARRLRYQALGKACIRHGITTLLVGHHADDQAETVLMRMGANYLGPGLSGIRRHAPIPECDGIYGCDSGKPIKVPVTPLSGYSPTMQTATIEQGGIHLHRPLLDFSKSSLRATCIANGLRWAEDKTNQDRTLGPRNAIRHLVRSERLPKALDIAGLLELAQQHTMALERTLKRVDHIFGACIVKLNPINGTVDVQFPSDTREMLLEGPDTEDRLSVARHRAAALLRKIMLLVSPLSKFGLADCRGPAEIIFPFLFTEGKGFRSEHGKVATAAKLLCRITSPTFESDGSPSGSIRCLFSRTPPTAQDKSDQIKALIYEIPEREQSIEWKQTPMTCFDGRYWIRLRYRLFNLSPGHRISVRFLERADLEELRLDHSNVSHWNALRQILKQKAPGKIRYTLPAIVQTWLIKGKDGKYYPKSKLLALPTLGWSGAGWEEHDKSDTQEAWQWIVRYKNVDFVRSLKHGFVG